MTRDMATLLLSDVEIREATDHKELIDGIEAAIKAEANGNAIVPPRLNLDLSGTWLRVMPAMVPSAGMMGLKVFHGAPGHGVRYLVILYDMANGAVLATLDGCYLTAARTAATTAVASKYLLPGGPVRLGVIGSGLEAETHCAALAAIKQLSEVKVYSPRETRRRSFAERMQAALGVSVQACNRPEEAVEGADEVVVATNTGPSRAIAYQSEWLRPSQHVSAIGSTNPNLREVETGVFRRADVLVFDAVAEQLAEESADVMEFCAEGGSLEGVLPLARLVAGEVPGRRRPEDITVFKSVGTALQDVAAAAVIYQRAMKLGLGSEVPELSVTKVFSHASQSQMEGVPDARLFKE
jgi:alanine dehydrogenase